MRPRCWFVRACFVLVVVVPPWARADERPCSLERLETIRRTLREARRLTRLWSYAWASGYAGFVAGSVVLSQTIPDHDQRVDFYFSAEAPPWAWPRR